MPDSGPPGPIQWYLKPWVVLVLIFFVLGPFALPLLYKSPKFSRSRKILLTVLTVAYTGYLVGVTLALWRSVSSELTQIQTLVRG